MATTQVPDTAKLMEPGHAPGDYIKSAKKKGTYPVIKYVLPNGIVFQDTSYLLFDLLDRIYSILSILPADKQDKEAVKNAIRAVASSYQLPSLFGGDWKNALSTYTSFLLDAVDKLGVSGLQELVGVLVKALTGQSYREFVERLARELEEGRAKPRRGVILRATLPVGDKVVEYTIEYVLKRVPFSDIYTYIVVPHALVIAG